MIESMQDLVEHLALTGMASDETVVPCTPDEVDEIRQAQGVEQLPEQYEQFLLTMGRRAGDLLRGTTFFYPGLVELAEEMPQLLEENDATGLAREGSVFVGMHQGYQLYWLEPGDPSGQLCWYEEGEDAIGQSWPSLLDFLVARAEEERRIKEKYGL